jgi:hypothetical protein
MLSSSPTISNIITSYSQSRSIGMSMLTNAMASQALTSPVSTSPNMAPSSSGRMASMSATQLNGSFGMSSLATLSTGSSYVSVTSVTNSPSGSSGSSLAIATDTSAPQSTIVVTGESSGAPIISTAAPTSSDAFAIVSVFDASSYLAASNPPPAATPITFESSCDSVYEVPDSADLFIVKCGQTRGGSVLPAGGNGGSNIGGNSNGNNAPPAQVSPGRRLFTKRAITTTDPNECVGICDVTPGCVGCTWNNVTHDCSMKASLGAGVFDPDVIFMYPIARNASQPVGQGVVHTITATLPAATTTIVQTVTANGSTVYITITTTLPGSLIPTTVLVTPGMKISATGTHSGPSLPMYSNISPNGLCGPGNQGMSCFGSGFGDCCSQYGYW